MDPKEVVRRGYEQAAGPYDEWSRRIDAVPRERYVARLAELVPAGSTVLELGCGTGLATSSLVERYQVVGVDFAAACLDRARGAAPGGRFVRSDMTRLAVRACSVDAVVGFYSLIHVPRHEQPSVLAQAAASLRPGGVLLVTMGAHDLPAGTDDDWRGVPMYWSSYDAATNVANVAAAGFDLLEASEVDQEEDGDMFTFLWVVARRSSAASVTITVDDPRSADVRALLERHLAFAHASTPSSNVHALDVSGLLDPGVTFVSARRDGRVVAVGALKQLAPDHGELKSMHTAEEMRGQGLGHAMVNHLLAEARRRGYRRVSLETGTGDPFAPARALYEAAGFRPCDPFGGYENGPHNTCMSLELE